MTTMHMNSFFDLSGSPLEELFAECNHPWEALKKLPGMIDDRLRRAAPPPKIVYGDPLPQTLIFYNGKVWSDNFKILGGDVTKGTFRVMVGGHETDQATVLHAGAVIWDERVFIGPGSVVEPGALIKGPTVIGSHTEVRQGAYIRGKCFIGSGCVVGHTTEVKSSIMLDRAKAGHFAYIGDSILGFDCNLGAGTKLANLKVRGSVVRIKMGGATLDTGLRKLGAIIGDHVEIGCNSVTNPGALIGRGSFVLPLTSVAPGYYEPKTVIGKQ